MIGIISLIGKISRSITKGSKTVDVYKLVTTKRKANDKIKNKKRQKRLAGKKARKINRV